MYTVSPREREWYFFRTLLVHWKGSSSYQKLRTVNGVQLASFRDAYAALGLLADDAEWLNDLRESYASRFHTLTELFALILVHCELSNLINFGPTICLRSFRTFGIDIVGNLQH